MLMGIAAAGRSEDWPRWRGAGFDGTASSVSHPFAGAFALQVRWKRPLGAGYSGVVVAEDKAVTMFSDGKIDYLIALSADRGEELWRMPLGEAFPPRDGSSGGPVSTPAIDRGVVYALSPRGVLVAARLKNGERIWMRNLVEEMQVAVPHWGFTTSPLVVQDRVVVITGGTPDRAVTALDRNTGATAWRAGSDEASYQSPMLANLGGKDVILAGGDKALIALDPVDGRQLWRYEHGGEDFYAKIINPVRIDKDRFLLTHKAEQTTLLQIGSKIETVWTTKELKQNYATPVVYGDLVFGYSGRFLSAVDARTGESRWRSRPPGDGFPIVVDGHLVVLTKRGAVVVAETSAEAYRENASLQVFSRMVWTPPSFADGRIYARDSYEEIAAIDIVPQAAATQTATIATKPDALRGIVPGSQFAKWVAETEKAPDAAARVKQYLSEHPASPVLEGDRVAHVLYTGPENEVLFRGDLFEIGQEIPMQRVAGTDLRYASLELEPDACFAYQILRNLENPIADPRNPSTGTSLNYPGPVAILAMPRAMPLPAPPAETLRGRIEELEIESPAATAEHLKWGGKRKIKIYLPPGYDDAPTLRYPAVYILLGDEMMEGPRLQTWIDREIGNSLPPLVALFVASTNAYELARTFREPHAKMITTQLVPLIEEKFRTIANPAQRILLGVDEAGFAAVEIGLRFPQVFGGVIAHSIFPLTGGDRELLALIDEGKASSGQRFYLDWGRYDPRRKTDGIDVPGFTRAVKERLAARGHNVAGREWNQGTPLVLLAPRSVLAIQTLLNPQ